MTEYVIDTLDNLDNLELKKRSDIHWARKIWHMSGVFGMFLAYVLLPETASSIVLALAVLLFLPVDFLRHRYPALNDWLVHAFKPIMRTHEIHKIAGTTYLLAGVCLVVAFFPRPVVALTLLFLAFADPIASFIGIKYGKDKIFGHKSIQGFMAAFVVCAVATAIYLTYYNIMLDRVIVVSLLAGLIGALAELVPIGKIDDNFTLPVLSSIGLYALFYVFGLFAG
ncbi:diacylglycerol/polyprenol kinase family protein [Bdellovibrio sp. HCB337]|uniref:diacylglycerol/polyprenol kinase family protein n=1 Tax=Bdellovibrio sp. HCB337 TaxID=3394358 RepID=UPI0039A72939